MQTLDISEATNTVAKPPTTDVTLVTVCNGRFQAVRDEFATITDNNVRFVKLTTLVNDLIRSVKTAPPGEQYRMQIEAIDKLLCVAAAARGEGGVHSYADLAAEIAFQSEELSRLQEQVDAKSAEIAQLVAQAHRPVLVDGKRKISLFCKRDGSISCRPE